MQCGATLAIENKKDDDHRNENTGEDARIDHISLRSLYANTESAADCKLQIINISEASQKVYAQSHDHSKLRPSLFRFPSAKLKNDGDNPDAEEGHDHVEDRSHIAEQVWSESQDLQVESIIVIFFIHDDLLVVFGVFNINLEHV